MDQHILWVDDEIELLEPHILLLEDKGYRVTRVSNGRDAVERVQSDRFDLIFLDEQMPGMNGLETLEQIKALTTMPQVVMVTKSEEEHIMDDAIGREISDYLIKPVHPKQVLLTCKRLLERRRIRDEQVSRDYLQSFGAIRGMLQGEPNTDEWIQIYQKLVSADFELENDEGLRQVLHDQQREANRAFGRFVETRYPDWIASSEETPADNRPVLSHDVIPQYVLPEMGQGKPVILFVIDCLRHDQWLEIERLVYPKFEMSKSMYYSILPTATPYSRNAIFSGLLPDRIAQVHRDAWRGGEEDEQSMNRHEEHFLRSLLERKHVRGKFHYEKVIRAEEGRSIAQTMTNHLENDLTAIVVNFVDNLAHSRSDSAVLQEIAPDERAYRALTRTWFEHSWLYETLDFLSSKDCTVIITTDHGVLRVLHPTKVRGDRETTTSLRYKMGRNLKCDTRHAIHVKDPAEFGLPSGQLNTHYIIAKEDFYFVYPTNYNYYVQHYRDTMQHGGVSLEEVLLPVITLRPS